MPAAAIVGAGSSLIGGILGANAASAAAKAQQQAEQKAISSTNSARDTALGTQNQVYQTDQNALAPYQQAGNAALGQMGSSVLQAGAGLNADQVLQNDPGYQFRLDQGMQALQRAQAAGGSIGSGGALKAAAQYSQDYASGEYGAAYNRFLQGNAQRFGQLSSIAGIGQNANQQLIGAGANYANQSSSIGMDAAKADASSYEGIGNAQAAGDMGVANAWSGAISGMAGSLSGLKFGGGKSGGNFDNYANGSLEE